jgi:RNA polymerase sigma factor (sigma-70 family)
VTIQEYNICVDDFSDGVFRFIMKNIKHKADAEDVVQMAFERLWKHHSNIKAESAKSFLFTTAYRCMIDLIRKNKRMIFPEELPEEMEGVARDDNKSFETRELIELGLKELSEIQRSVLMLRDYEGYSYKEIAEITEITEAQVKVYIFRARKKLQAFIKSAHEAA